MRVEVISDIHGQYDLLAHALDRAEQLVILGDLLDYTNYQEPEHCILGRIFGADHVSALGRMRRLCQHEAMHAHQQQLWATLENPEDTIRSIVTDSYEQVLRIVAGSTTLVSLGNVDVPEIWNDLAPAAQRNLDGETVHINGHLCGFVAGGALKTVPQTWPWKYYDRDHHTYRSTVARLSGIDILMSHLPPRIPELRYDTTAGRNEMYGPGLLELITT